MNKSSNISANLKLSDLSTTESGIIEARVHRQLQKEVSDYLKPHGLTAMEWFVIGYLYEHSSTDTPLSVIAKNLQTTLPYLTNMINQLEAKGLVERVERSDDNRFKPIQLMPLAENMYNKVESDLRVQLGKFVYKKVSAKDFETYIRVMFQLAA
jgi:DNA-binding MarR family transcriptional regulator